MQPNHIHSVEFVTSLIERKHEYITYVPGRGICAIKRMMFTTGLFYGLTNYNLHYCDGRYCFHTKAEAVASLKDWNGIGDPPDYWIKHFGLFQYSNPSLWPIENLQLLNLTEYGRNIIFERDIDLYKKFNITFHIKEVSELHIRIVTEQGQCARSVNYNIPELVRITKQIFEPVISGKRLVIHATPYEPNQQSSKPI